MAFLDGLKGLFKDAIKIDLRNLVNIHINVNSGNTTTGDKKDSSIDAFMVSADGKRLEIDPAKLTVPQQNHFKKILKESVLNEDYSLIEETSQNLLQEFWQVDSSAANQELLKRLRTHIPVDDFKALRASLLLRARYLSTGDIGYLKEDIIRMYGKRGGVIANMCTAGYFEEMIVPILNGIEGRPGFTEEAFNRLYETIIAEHGFALFVTASMTAKKVEKAVGEKIETNKRYGLGYVSIHGIGKANIKKIRQSVENLLPQYPTLEKTAETLIANGIFIRLDFKRPEQPLTK